MISVLNKSVTVSIPNKPLPEFVYNHLSESLLLITLCSFASTDNKSTPGIFFGLSSRFLNILWSRSMWILARFRLITPLCSAADEHRTKVPWTRFYTTAVRFVLSNLVHKCYNWTQLIPWPPSAWEATETQLTGIFRVIMQQAVVISYISGQPIGPSRINCSG
jgi:hypothetical protein